MKSLSVTVTPEQSGSSETPAAPVRKRYGPPTRKNTFAERNARCIAILILLRPKMCTALLKEGNVAGSIKAVPSVFKNEARASLSPESVMKLLLIRRAMRQRGLGSQRAEGRCAIRRALHQRNLPVEF